MVASQQFYSDLIQNLIIQPFGLKYSKSDSQHISSTVASCDNKGRVFWETSKSSSLTLLHADWDRPEFTEIWAGCYFSSTRCWQRVSLRKISLFCRNLVHAPRYLSQEQLCSWLRRFLDTGAAYFSVLLLTTTELMSPSVRLHDPGTLQTRVSDNILWSDDVFTSRDAALPDNSDLFTNMTNSCFTQSIFLSLFLIIDFSPLYCTGLFLHKLDLICTATIRCWVCQFTASQHDLPVFSSHSEPCLHSCLWWCSCSSWWWWVWTGAGVWKYCVCLIILWTIS